MTMNAYEMAITTDLGGKLIGGLVILGVFLYFTIPACYYYAKFEQNKFYTWAALCLASVLVLGVTLSSVIIIVTVMGCAAMTRPVIKEPKEEPVVRSRAEDYRKYNTTNYHKK
jgi:hypothetical protein